MNQVIAKVQHSRKVHAEARTRVVGKIYLKTDQ